MLYKGSQRYCREKEHLDQFIQCDSRSFQNQAKGILCNQTSSTQGGFGAHKIKTWVDWQYVYMIHSEI